jgi:hypothetical protein
MEKIMIILVLLFINCSTNKEVLGISNSKKEVKALIDSLNNRGIYQNSCKDFVNSIESYYFNIDSNDIELDSTLVNKINVFEDKIKFIKFHNGDYCGEILSNISSLKLSEKYRKYSDLERLEIIFKDMLIEHQKHNLIGYHTVLLSNVMKKTNIMILLDRFMKLESTNDKDLFLVCIMQSSDEKAKEFIEKVDKSKLSEDDLFFLNGHKKRLKLLN